MWKWIGADDRDCAWLMYSNFMETLTIFCDGASKGNPGPGGWGAIVAGWGSVVELGGADARTTNNRMELMAAIEALREAGAHPRTERMVVRTDSSYVINGISKWVHGWKKNGWVTAQKKEVMNRDLWERLITAVDALETTIDWQYVGGHVGIPGNERVDAIASDLAEGKKVVLYRGPREHYEVDLDALGAQAQKKAAKSASSARSKAKAYSYVSRVDGKVMVHKTWAECEARVRGKTARFKKALSPEDERAIIADFSK